MGKDVVGEVFAKSIAKYTAEYKKQPEGSDEIIKKLESDIAALVQPPKLPTSGGNVYETHQII
jgi:plasmid stabilization system protein ParE